MFGEEHLMEKNKLNKGESICSMCEGTGAFPSKLERYDELQRTCPKCNGRGIVDWVTNAMGKPPLPSYTSTMSSSSSTPSSCKNWWFVAFTR
jgi:hypothetical protein